MFIAIFLIVLLILYVFLLLYYRSGWQSLPEDQVLKPAFKTFITVIIPARNEETNILPLLNSISGQGYPSELFEVIVVDDFSTDETASVVRQFASENMRLVQLSDYIEPGINSYKKKSIETGINQSKGELIVTTDADCIVPSTWLENLAGFYESNSPAFIGAPVAYNSPGPQDTLFIKIFKIFQLLDFTVLQGITGGSVQKGFHAMCNGANLAYPKKIFHEVNGFEGIDHIASGDDLLLMQKIAKHSPGKIYYFKSAAAIVHTKPLETIGSFFNQRIRWASKSGEYSDFKIKSVLLLVYLFNLLLLFIPLISILVPKLYMYHYQFFLLQVWILAIIIKTCFEVYFLFPVAKFFNQTRWLWIFPFLQPVHIMYTVFAGALGLTGKYEWKERKVR